eukprot:gene19801-23716_t
MAVGTDTSDIFLIDQHDSPLVFNRNGRINNARCTAVEWAPGSATQLLAAFANGVLLVLDTKRPDQPLSQSDTARVTTDPVLSVGYGGRSSGPVNPVHELVVSKKAISALSFSPDGRHLAIASLDGLLSVYLYETMQLVVAFRSYFGGFLCVDWSADGKYLASGGEDDHMCVWSFEERCLVARGQGHQSWVSSVKFDPFIDLDAAPIVPVGHSSSYSSSYAGTPMATTLVGPSTTTTTTTTNNTSHPTTAMAMQTTSSPSYRILSGGEDTRLIFWDFSKDLLKKPRTALPSTPSVQQQQKTPTNNKSTKVTQPMMNQQQKPVELVGTDLIVNSISRNQAPILYPPVNHRIYPDPVTDIAVTKELIITSSCQRLTIWARPNTVANIQKADSAIGTSFNSPKTP